MSADSLMAAAGAVGLMAFVGLNMYRSVRSIARTEIESEEKYRNNKKARMKAQHASIMGGEEIGSSGRKTSVLKRAALVLRVAALPFATAAAAVASAAYPSYLLQCGAFPALFADYAAASLANALPSIFVGRLSEAFEFGRLSELVVGTLLGPASTAANATATTSGFAERIAQALALWGPTGGSHLPPAQRAAVLSALEAAARIAGRTTVELSQLLEVGELIRQQEAHVSITGRILGAFSIVNFIWVVSIAGLSCLALPFIGVFARPLVVLLRDGALWLYQRVLVPLYLRLRPVIEVAFYWTALEALVEGQRYADTGDRLGSGGIMMAITGLALFHAAYGYTLHLHWDRLQHALFPRQADGLPSSASFYNPRTGHVGVPPSVLASMGLLALGGLFAAGPAVVHQSLLLGYYAVGALFVLLGFHADADPLCVAVGFHDMHGLARGVGASSAILTVVIAGHISGVFARHPRSVYPFEQALSVLGGTVYLLGVDILAAIYPRKIEAHVLHIGSMAALGALGSVGLVPGLATTAAVFACLYGFTLYCTLPLHAMRHGKHDGAFIVWLFGLFALLYASSLALTRHPDILVRVLSHGGA